MAENICTGEKFRFAGNQLFKDYNIRPARIIDRNLPIKTVEKIEIF